ncbi:unnamed protein product [Paramecium sonneborni]|uniref:Uncharacterized protein n=1 Tax=Paramecium sonneborni TaxID=65129 RepID=A0A8S1RTP6_9CILI|nr:unnamed protein product [Paramecium sonneborni]
MIVMILIIQIQIENQINLIFIVCSFQLSQTYFRDEQYRWREAVSEDQLKCDSPGVNYYICINRISENANMMQVQVLLLKIQVLLLNQKIPYFIVGVIEYHLISKDVCHSFEFQRLSIIDSCESQIKFLY